ncbi:MAG: hypothetical protein PWP08_1194 [Methanofollis sp.]|nr:hypothetical protein [Methanofollis sp.]
MYVTMTQRSDQGVADACVLCCLALLLLAVCAAPVSARGATISDIQPGDTIFVYEEGLDIAALQKTATGNPVTALRRFTDDDTTKGIVKELPVSDDRNFDVLDASVGSYTGLYYAYSQIDGLTGKTVYVRYPEVSIDAVLANPNHADRITGITIPDGTAIAVKVVSPFVGIDYIVGSTHASVDIVVTTPGGAELTTFGGANLADLPVTAQQFYTDDAGISSPIVLDRLEEGTYTLQAQWRSPQSFADSAQDSNVITFSVGDRIGVDVTATPTTTTTTPKTTIPPVTTARPTTVSTTPPVTASTVLPTTTAPPTTVPTTQASGTTLLPIIGMVSAILLFVRRK